MYSWAAWSSVSRRRTSPPSGSTSTRQVHVRYGNSARSISTSRCKANELASLSSRTTPVPPTSSTRKRAVPENSWTCQSSGGAAWSGPGTNARESSRASGMEESDSGGSAPPFRPGAPAPSGAGETVRPFPPPSSLSVTSGAKPRIARRSRTRTPSFRRPGRDPSRVWTEFVRRTSMPRRGCKAHSRPRHPYGASRSSCSASRRFASFHRRSISSRVLSRGVLPRFARAASM